MADPASKLRYQNLITPGLVEPLSAIAFHGDAPLERRLFAGGSVHPSANCHLAVHEIRQIEPRLDRAYCLPHAHNCNELNVLLSLSKLVFRIVLGDETYVVEAPSSIFIPAGLVHCANVVEGTGFFITLLDCGDYSQSLTN